MSTGESVDFSEYHRWRLEKIVELTDRLSGVAKPTWAFSLSPGKELKPDPSVLSDVIDGQGELDPTEREGLDIFLQSRKHAAEIELSAAYAMGLMHQIAKTTEEERRTLEIPDADTFLERCSDAGFIVHEFTDRETDEQYEVSRTWIMATALNGQLINLQAVTLKKEDDLLSESLSIHKHEDKISVFRQINPAKDELLERLIKVSRMGGADSDSELFEAGYAALVGIPQAEHKLDKLPVYQADEEYERLMNDLRDRLKMVRAARSMNYNEGLPTQEQLDHIIELLEEMAELED